MPEITVTHAALLIIAVIAGLAIGWAIRASRSASEHAAISAGWQEQLEVQYGEHERLREQNKSLMEQNNQYQASNRDSIMRANELSDALREAFERRDALQGQIKDIRNSLEAAITERDQLQSAMQNRSIEDEVMSTDLEMRDEEIAQLTKKLEGWQERVPPLIARFRARNEEALELEAQLAQAKERISALDAMVGSEDTRVEPVDPKQLGDDLDASNESLEEDDEAGDLIDPAEFAELIAENQDDQAGSNDVLERFETASDPVNGQPADNLKLIKGVGPAIEKTLNEMGIRRFDQIAEMSEYEIDRIAKTLKGFRSRIYREDWIGQARELQEQNSANLT